MSFSFRTSDFFVVGGTLPYDAPSYVKRQADERLFQLALAGQFAYVLTARQMGKSSLMARTALRLRQRGVRIAFIDLTTIGIVSVEAWYLSLLIVLTRQLRLAIDPEPWWQEHSSLSSVQCFIDFLRDVVLTEIQEPIVLFIDEIDRTLDLEFTDDFFAAIRALYNARAQDPTFERLTFVLLGVASPPDLIKDRTRTPFNIGQGVLLQDFNRNDTVPLQIGLEKEYPDQAEAIFTRIYHWTDGHPYLTQKLCQEVVKAEEESWTNGQIDELVERTFLSDKAGKEVNLQFVRDKILTHPKLRQLLALYRKVYEGQKVADDAQSPLQTQLKLSGLVKVENSYLRVRNEIYQHTFDFAWIKEHTTIAWTRIFPIVLAFLVMLYGTTVAVGPFSGLGDSPSPTPTPIRAGIVLNEILPRPATDWNRDQTINSGDEYIEIFNASGSDIEITGMVLDAVDDSSPYMLRGTLEPNVITVFFGSQTGIVLSDKEGDGVRLLGADGMVLDEYLYLEVPQDDQAWSRDKAKIWHTNWSPSPGEPNQPTESPTHVQTPSNDHVPPVLLAPEDNATITNQIPLQWSWDGTLQADEYFDVRVWREGEPATGIAWTKEKYYFFDPSIKGDGDYLWSVMIIRRRNGKFEANLSEPTPPRRLKIKLENGPSITATP